MKTVIHTKYVHYTAVGELEPSEVQAVAKALDCIPKYFPYSVIRVSADGTVSFTHSPNWDTANEPDVGNSYLVSPDGTAVHKLARGQIYHHKWQFVSEDYKGFDIEQSKLRSVVVNRISVGVKTRIGYKNFWLNLLAKHGVEV